MIQVHREMEVAVAAGLFAKWNMHVDARHCAFFK
jgi:hypothetical protein